MEVMLMMIVKYILKFITSVVRFLLYLIISYLIIFLIFSVLFWYSDREDAEKYEEHYTQFYRRLGFKEDIVNFTYLPGWSKSFVSYDYVEDGTTYAFHEQRIFSSRLELQPQSTDDIVDTLYPYDMEYIWPFIEDGFKEKDVYDVLERNLPAYTMAMVPYPHRFEGFRIDFSGLSDEQKELFKEDLRNGVKETKNILKSLRSLDLETYLAQKMVSVHVTIEADEAWIDEGYELGEGAPSLPDGHYIFHVQSDNQEHNRWYVTIKDGQSTVEWE